MGIRGGIDCRRGGTGIGNVSRAGSGLARGDSLARGPAVGGRLGLLVSNFADHGKIGKDELDELYAILDRAAGREE